jgi:cytochrome c peroxidase
LSGPAQRARALRPVLLLTFALAACGVGLAQAPAPPPDFDTAPSEEPIVPIPAPLPADPLKILLGERLFEDPRLSRGNVRSCLTCHDIRNNGASGKARPTSLDGTPLPYETLTVFNAALSFRLSWQGRYRTLESQLVASLVNPGIMGTNVDEIIGKLRLDPRIVSQFENAFGHGPDASSLLDAIATFERSLLTPGSRFDRWLSGDKAALSEQELAGYRLFKSLGCIACHQGVNVGGNLFERRGIFRPPQRGEPELLRVPSLRNVATTAPYFRDSSAASLPEAVRKMGRAQLNTSLTDPQVDAIVAFLRTLTGNYRGRPVRENP